MNNIPYNRLVQWLAGPISILAGWLATQITLHFGIFGPLGLGSSQIAHAIVIAVSFAVGAGLTYAAHHKWLDNLVKWVDQNVAPNLPPVADSPPAPGVQNPGPPHA